MARFMFSVFLKINILLTLISNLNIATGQTVAIDFGVQKVLAGKTCSDVVFTMDDTSSVQCVVVCQQHTSCKSVFYDRGANVCTGCYVIYTGDGVASWPVNAGTEHFGPYAAYGDPCSISERPCSEESNVCYSSLGVCVCDPATNYYPSSGSCVHGCTTWGDTFQRYPGWHVFQNNLAIVSGVNDVNACLKNCTTIAECCSVDHYLETKRCAYNAAYARTAPTSWVQRIAADSYVRNCA